MNGEAQNMDVFEIQAGFFKALSHPSRLKILEALKEKDSCVCDLVDFVKEPQPQVSRHLAALKAAGILTAEKKGARTCHRIKDKNVMKLIELSLKIIKAKNENIMSALEKGE
jgi:ArsR family transcriptional regulator